MRQEQNWLQGVMESVIPECNKLSILHFVASNFVEVKQKVWEYTSPPFNKEGKYLIINIEIEDENLELEVTSRYKEESSSYKTLAFSGNVNTIKVAELKDMIKDYIEELVLGKK
jgi:hypothetical protein